MAFEIMAGIRWIGQGELEAVDYQAYFNRLSP